MRAAKVQASLRIRAVSPEPPLLAHTSSESRGTFRQKARSLAAPWQNKQCGCVPSEDSDQPGHLPSLIRVFAVRIKKAWVLSYPLIAQRRLWCPGWSESSLGAQPFCWFMYLLMTLIGSCGFMNDLIFPASLITAFLFYLNWGQNRTHSQCQKGFFSPNCWLKNSQLNKLKQWPVTGQKSSPEIMLFFAEAF